MRLFLFPQMYFNIRTGKCLPTFSFYHFKRQLKFLNYSCVNPAYLTSDNEFTLFSLGPELSVLTVLQTSQSTVCSTGLQMELLILATLGQFWVTVKINESNIKSAQMVYSQSILQLASNHIHSSTAN